MENQLPRMHEPRQSGEETDCVSDLQLDVLLGGESSRERQNAIEQHLAECERCKVRLESLRRFRDGLTLPRLENPATAPATTTAPMRQRYWHAAAGVGIALAASVALWIGVAGRGSPNGELQTDGVRSKGDARLGFFVKRGERITRGAANDVLEPGDRIEFTFRAPTSGYLALVSVDGSGKATIYYPVGSVTAPIEAGEQTLLQSTLLDEVLGPERVHAFFCVRPVQVEPIRLRLESAKGDPLHIEGCTIESLMFEKRKP